MRTIEQMATEVVDAAYHLHVKLGPGLLESVYEAVLAKHLEQRGLRVARQVPVPIQVDGVHFDEGFRADIIVEDMLILELKSVEELRPVHGKQLLTYLRLTNRSLGLLINFGYPDFRHAVHRVVNGHRP